MVTRVPDPASDQNTSRNVSRWIPLGLILCLMITAYAMGLQEHLNLQDIAANRAMLRAQIHQHWVLAVLIYAAVYAAAVALSFPAAGFITVVGGLLFGWVTGAATTIFAATLGATIIFLAAKTSLEKLLARKSGQLLTKVRDGFSENAFNYLLFLRLVPLFPFWLVNIAAALSHIKLGTFVLATFFGIIPITLVFSFVGASLDATLDLQQEAHDACVMQNGPLQCPFDLALKHIVTPQMLIALACLGLLALLPVVYKKWRAKS